MYTTIIELKQPRQKSTQLQQKMYVEWYDNLKITSAAAKTILVDSGFVHNL